MTVGYYKPGTNEFCLQTFLTGKDRIKTFSDKFDPFKLPAPCLWLMDGTGISVQAGPSLYCTPKDLYGPYYSVEVGYPTREIKELLPYAEESERPTGTVYGYVPVELVEKIIADAGGVCVELTIFRDRGYQ